MGAGGGEGGASFPSAACRPFLIPVSFPSHSKRSGLMFLYPEHVFCYYCFHFRALPGSRLLLGEVLQLLGESRELGEEQGGRWGHSPAWIKRRRGSCPLQWDPGLCRLLRGSPSPTARGANIPNARAALLPTALPKRAGNECFPGNQGRRVWETLSVLHLGLFELHFGGPVSCSESLRFPAKTTNKTVGNLKYRNLNLVS